MIRTLLAAMLAFTSTSALAGNCPDHPKYPRGQCAKQVGGTCQWNNSTRKWNWWTTNDSQRVRFYECLRRLGAA